MTAHASKNGLPRSIGTQWLLAETGCHKKQDRNNETCPFCTHRIKNPGLSPGDFGAFEFEYVHSDTIEHHAFFDCSGYPDTREQYRDLFQILDTAVGLSLGQLQGNRPAKSPPQIRMLRINKVKSNGSVPGPNQTSERPAIQLRAGSVAHILLGFKHGAVVSGGLCHYWIPVHFATLQLLMQFCGSMLCRWNGAGLLGQHSETSVPQLV